MKLIYDPRVDAASVEVRGPVGPDDVEHLEMLDQDRNVRYGVDDQVVEYEFLNVRRYGVRLDDLEHREELARLFGEAGFAERDWSAPRPQPRPRKRAAG
jgi:hypothetical protein